MHFEEFSLKCTKMQTISTPFQKGFLPNSSLYHPSQILQPPKNVNAPFRRLWK